MENKETKIALVGMNHINSSVEDREQFQINRKDIPDFLNSLSSRKDVEAVEILCTCNRLEFYMIIDKNADASKIVRKIYAEKNYHNASNLKKLLYSYVGVDVTRHLFKVACGLDSMVLGEYQIQGQLKEAYSIACQVKTVDKILHKLMHAAFRVGKKVRNDTTLGEGKQSVSGVASKILIENLKQNETIAIIGVNENSKIMAQELTRNGFNNLVFVNRTLYKAEMMAEQWGGRAASLDMLEKILFDADAVFSSTGAQGFIVSAEMMRKLVVQERCPRLIVDMAIPRDIDTSLLPKEIVRYNIDKLKNFLDKQELKKFEAVKDAERIIEEEVQIFQAWSDTQIHDILEPYSEKFEITRIQLLDEIRNQFSEQVYLKVDKLTKKLVHRLQSNFVNVLIKEQEKKKIDIAKLSAIE